MTIPPALKSVLALGVIGIVFGVPIGLTAAHFADKVPALFEAPEKLNVTVNFFPLSGGFELSDNEDVWWDDCLLTLNGVFTAKMPHIGPKVTGFIYAEEFADERGERFNRFMKPQKLNIECRKAPYAVRSVDLVVH